jgi:hypothetical protein
MTGAQQARRKTLRRSPGFGDLGGTLNRGASSTVTRTVASRGVEEGHFTPCSQNCGASVLAIARPKLLREAQPTTRTTRLANFWAPLQHEGRQEKRRCFAMTHPEEVATRGEAFWRTHDARGGKSRKPKRELEDGLWFKHAACGRERRVRG